VHPVSVATKSLLTRLYEDGIERELAKIVTYDGVKAGEKEAELDALGKKHGREKAAAAAREMTEFDEAERVWRLKADVRRFCFGLLGPAPEDYAWACPEKIPKPPRPTIEEQIAEPTIDDVAEALANTIEMETGHTVEIVREDGATVPRRWAVPPEMTPEAMIQRLTDSELQGLIEDAKWTIQHHDKSAKARPFKKDLKLAEAELERRQLNERPDPDVERFQKMTKQQLKDALALANYETTTYSADTVTQQEAVRHIELIREEMRKRGGFEPGPYAKYSERDLNEALQRARLNYNRFSPSSKQGQEASHQIDDLIAEYQARGLTVPILRTGEEPRRRRRRGDAA
jgi:hypothetical protein